MNHLGQMLLMTYHERVEECHSVVALKLATAGEPVDKLHHQWLKQLLGDLGGG